MKAGLWNCGKINVKNQCDILGNQLMEEGYLEHQQSETINKELSLVSTIYNGRILIINESGRIVKDTYGLAEGKFNITEEVLKAYSGETQSSYNKKKDYFSLAFPIHEKEKRRDGRRSSAVYCVHRGDRASGQPDF